MIYFLQSGIGGPIKIGFTSSRKLLPKRVMALQIGNPEIISILGTVSGGQRYEKVLHRKFKENHIRGEWFRPEKEMIRWIYIKFAEVL